jgi:RNA polymerase sigma-70 factor (ECF subfamily)
LRPGFAKNSAKDSPTVRTILSMNDAPNPEPALRLAALAGDAGAWQALFDSAFETVASYARWRCGGRADLCDDAVQETWLTAARKLGGFDPARSRFAAWVCGVAANVCRNLVRKRLRAAKRVRSLMAVPEPAVPDHTSDHDPEAVARALAELPDRYEEALRLKYLEQRSVTEMAKLLGDTVKAVESLLTRARQAFREKYQP